MNNTNKNIIQKTVFTSSIEFNISYIKSDTSLFLKEIQYGRITLEKVSLSFNKPQYKTIRNMKLNTEITN